MNRLQMLLVDPQIAAQALGCRQSCYQGGCMQAIPFSRVPVKARYMPIWPGSWFRKCAAPTSGYRPIPHSGMANNVLHGSWRLKSTLSVVFFCGLSDSESLTETQGQETEDEQGMPCTNTCCHVAGNLALCFTVMHGMCEGWTNSRSAASDQHLLS